MPINSLLYPANSASGGFEVVNSVRYDRASSTYMQRTFGSGGNRDKFTFSGWFKRGETGVEHRIFSSAATSGTGAYAALLFHDSDDLIVFNYDGSSSYQYFRTDRKFRDLSAWFHIVLAYDTTQGTNTNRAKLYINGVQETSFSTATYPNQNTDLQFNLAEKHWLGAGDDESGGQSRFLQGYISEVCFIDNAQLDPTSFGEFDEDSGIWKPIDVSGLTFGTTGFYLDFEDSSALGNDVAGSNNFTVANLTAVDQTTDTCTNNFATLNGLATGLDATLSEGNLKMVSGTATTRSGTASSIGLTAGKWFAEFKITGSANGIVGIAGTTQNRTATDDDDIGNYPGRTQQGYGYLSGGNVYNNSSAVSGSFASFTTNDFIGVALDLDNNLLYFYKNGAIQNSGTGIDISGITPHSGNWFFAVGDGSGSTASTVECNFGNPITALSSAVADGNGFGAFEFTPKSGHLALCTKNLAENG